jgi:Ino eighty subunit 1
MEPYNYDTDGTRSASPGLHQSLEAGSSRTASRLSASEMHINSILNENPTASTPPHVPRNGRGRWHRDVGGDRGGPQRIILKTKMHQIPDSTSPAPPGAGHPVLHSNPDRRQRPLTAHQQAVEKNRQQRVEYLLDRKKRLMFERRKKQRENEGAIWRALKRCEQMEDPFMNSEDEGFKDTNGLFKDQGIGGLTALVNEDEDFGEEAAAYSASLRRARRRLERWDEAGKASGDFLGVKKASNGVDRDAEEEEDYEEDYEMPKQRGLSLGAEEADEDEGQLDDMDRELLGEIDPADEEEAEEYDEDEMDVN